MVLSLKRLLSNGITISEFVVVFEERQQSLVSLNEYAADYIDDLNILIHDLFIYLGSNDVILSWDGSINRKYSDNKFTISVNNHTLFDQIKNSETLKVSSYTTVQTEEIHKYNLVIHNKDDFDYINNNQVLFIDRLPEFKRFMIMNKKDVIYINKRVINYTVKGEDNDVLKLTSDVEFHISYLNKHIKVYNKILDKVDDGYVYVSTYLYNLIDKNTSLSKDKKILTNFNTNKVKALEELDDFEVSINYLNCVDDYLQVIGTNGEEFQLNLDSAVLKEGNEIEKYDYLTSNIVIADVDLQQGINFLNLSNNKVYELHRLCFYYALNGSKVLLIDIPFLFNIINDKKLHIADIASIYIIGAKDPLREFNEDDNNIYQLMKVFLEKLKRLALTTTNSITVVLKNCDYLFKNDMFKKDEPINSNYYKWQNYFLEFNNFLEETAMTKKNKIHLLIQSEDYEDDTKIPSFFDDLYLINNKINNLNIEYPHNVNDYRDYLNWSKSDESYIELSKRALNINELNVKDIDEISKPIYGITTTMTKINAIFEKSVLFKKLYQFKSNQNLNILIYGLPSMGKTLLINQLNNLLIKKYKIIPNNSYFKYHNTLSLISKYIGESEKNIRKMFTQAREHIKNNNSLYFIILDNIDTLLPRRGNDNSNITDKLVNTFLTELDGIDSLISNKNLIVVCVTNRPDKVDPAVLRPGRIENHIKVEYSDKDFSEVVENSVKDYGLDGVDVESIVSKKDLFTVGGLLKTFNECKMNGSRVVVDDLIKEVDIVDEYNRYFDKFENKVISSEVDTKESYM